MRRRFCVAVSLFFAFSGNGSLVAWAQFSGSPETRVAQFEVVLLGNVRNGESLEQRLQTLESNVFGQARRGDVSERLDAIGKVVEPGSASTLMPPEAPGLDAPGAGPPEAPAVEPELAATGAAVGEAANESDLLKQGVEKFKEGQLEDAEQLFHRVVAYDRDNVHALYNLGAIAERRGQLPDAQNYYRLALSVNPGDRQIQAAADEVARELAKRQLSASAQGSGARTRPADAYPQAEREFTLSADKTRLEQQARREQQARLAAQANREQKVRRGPVLPVVGAPQIRFSSAGRGAGSLLRSAAGAARAGTRIGLTAAAIHCPKCRRAIMGAQWLDIFGVRPNLR